MTVDAIRRVRSFNRAVTERVGALDEGYLGVAARWARRACCGRSASTGPRCGELRRRLGMDSGYASRLLRSLEARGWSRWRRPRATAGYAAPA